MARLAQLLDDVLAGRRTFKHSSTFHLLRQFAPERAAELHELESASRVSPIPTAVEQENTAKNSRTNREPTIRLTRNEMKAILREQRPTTVEEVEWLIAHGDDHNVRLSETEELELQHIAARLLASKHIADVRARNHNEEFIARTVGTFRTECGDLSRSEVGQLEAIRVEAIKAIQKCEDHVKSRCPCWKAAREALFELRCVTGEGSPVSMGALAVWNTIDAVARDRPNRQHATTDQQDGPPGIIYNWRHFKSPEYTAAVIGELDVATGNAGTNRP